VEAETGGIVGILLAVRVLAITVIANDSALRPPPTFAVTPNRGGRRNAAVRAMMKLAVFAAIDVIRAAGERRAAVLRHDANGFLAAVVALMMMAVREGGAAARRDGSATEQLAMRCRDAFAVDVFTMSFPSGCSPDRQERGEQVPIHRGLANRRQAASAIGSRPSAKRPVKRCWRLAESG